MGEAVNRWLHLLAMATWVGPQLFLFLAAIPVLRTVGSETDPIRLRATEAMVRRFNVMGWSALGLLILTGIGNIFNRGQDFAFDYDFRYAWILTVKLALVVLTVVLTALHSLVIGPRLLTAQSTGSDATIRRLRRQSIIVSVINFIIALAILFLAALLMTQSFSFQPA